MISTYTKFLVVLNATIGVVGCATYKKKNKKDKKMILENVKDHVSPHVTGKSHAFEIWAYLTKFYQSTNET